MKMRFKKMTSSQNFKMYPNNYVENYSRKYPKTEGHELWECKGTLNTQNKNVHTAIFKIDNQQRSTI